MSISTRVDSKLETYTHLTVVRSFVIAGRIGRTHGTALNVHYVPHTSISCGLEVRSIDEVRKVQRVTYLRETEILIVDGKPCREVIVSFRLVVVNVSVTAPLYFRVVVVGDVSDIVVADV